MREVTDQHVWAPLRHSHWVVHSYVTSRFLLSLSTFSLIKLQKKKSQIIFLWSKVLLYSSTSSSSSVFLLADPFSGSCDLPNSVNRFRLKIVLTLEFYLWCDCDDSQILAAPRFSLEREFRFIGLELRFRFLILEIGRWIWSDLGLPHCCSECCRCRWESHAMVVDWYCGKAWCVIEDLVVWFRLMLKTYKDSTSWFEMVILNLEAYIVQCSFLRLCLFLLYNLMIEVSLSSGASFCFLKIDRAAEYMIRGEDSSFKWLAVTILCLYGSMMGACLMNRWLIFITFLCALTNVNEALSPDGTAIFIFKSLP